MYAFQPYWGLRLFSRQLLIVERPHMYEHKRHHVLPWYRFIRRASRHLLIGLAIFSVAVGAGTVGYHTAGDLPWLDSFLNASMILSGMGPVDRMVSAGGKLFAALYALFSGVVFIGVMGVILAPWVHRLLHLTHLEER
jgi:hypothetical protein